MKTGDELTGEDLIHRRKLMNLTDEISRLDEYAHAIAGDWCTSEEDNAIATAMLKQKEGIVRQLWDEIKNADDLELCLAWARFFTLEEDYDRALARK